MKTSRDALRYLTAHVRPVGHDPDGVAAGAAGGTGEDHCAGRPGRGCQLPGDGFD